VSTPQQLAVADVRRGVEMFRNPEISVPILGIIENMAWFTPAELPDSRYYIFGKGGAREFARSEGIDLLGEIPLILAGEENPSASVARESVVSESENYYSSIACKIVEKLGI
jgi:ATP-binding protein involved in chromosome partitioning